MYDKIYHYNIVISLQLIKKKKQFNLKKKLGRSSNNLG